MDERLQFVARRLAGEAMAELCREFGISRKTGYKIFDRYQECGLQGLTDRSRRPYRYANQLSPRRSGEFATHAGSNCAEAAVAMRIGSTIAPIRLVSLHGFIVELPKYVTTRV
jgi:transposase-like protein